MVMPSFEDLVKIRAVLEAGWSEDTAYVLPDYNGDPKSVGQCYVTARALNHVFGWQIMFNGSGGNNHYWNCTPSGLEVDFTSDQMGGDGIYPLEELGGKPRSFKPLDQCKSINPRLKRYLVAVEQPLRKLKQELWL